MTNYLDAIKKNVKYAHKNIIITDIQPGFVDTSLSICPGAFWIYPLEKAVDKIFKAIKNKKSKSYLRIRWAILAWYMKLFSRWI
jgi:short-subunit dehydrogenase